MADTKISGLPASTTPLVGTEVLPIVQGATTKQVTVANLTAGRDLLINTLTAGLGAGAVATNTALGFQALNSNTTGANNTAIGYNALKSVVSNGGNTAIGYQALFNNTSGNNTAIGQSSLQTNTNGTFNVAIGTNALTTANATANTAIGYNALQNCSGGANNVAIGYSAASGITFGSNNIVIGFNSAPSANTVSNEITIGNSTSKVIRYPHAYSTVANLPAATIGQGSRTFVTDALTPVFQATVVGGGAVFTPVYSDGTNWKVG